MTGVKVDFKAVPGVVWVCLTVCFIAVLTAFVVSSAIGSDGTEIRSFLNTVLNFAALIVSGSGAIYAGAAARNAQTAKEQTNGALDARIQDAVTAALTIQRTDDIQDAKDIVKGVTDNGRPSV